MSQDKDHSQLQATIQYSSVYGNKQEYNWKPDACAYYTASERARTGEKHQGPTRCCSLSVLSCYYDCLHGTIYRSQQPNSIMGSEEVKDPTAIHPSSDAKTLSHDMSCTVYIQYMPMRLIKNLLRTVQYQIFLLKKYQIIQNKTKPIHVCSILGVKQVKQYICTVVTCCQPYTCTCTHKFSAKPAWKKQSIHQYHYTFTRVVCGITLCITFF